METMINLLLQTAEEGSGYFPAEPNTVLNDRYTVNRLLGYGQYSSTILASDPSSNPPGRFVAIKILTAYATSLNYSGKHSEVSILKKAMAIDENCVLPFMLDNFALSGPHGVHIAIVLTTLTTDLDAFRRTAPGDRLPSHTVRMTVECLLLGLEKLHSIGVIHTDIKPSNIMFNIGENTAETQKELDAAPLTTDGQVELPDGKRYTVLLPQPLQHDFKWDDLSTPIEPYDLVLNNFGGACLESDPQDYAMRTPLPLRAPEVILRAGYDTKLDIWAIGCLTFELLTGICAFSPEATEHASLDEVHLLQILELVCEPIPFSLLTRSKLASKYFTPDGTLLPITPISRVSLETTLKELTELSDDDIFWAADFIRSCFKLDPNDRPSAEKLLYHEWVTGGEIQVAGWHDPTGSIGKVKAVVPWQYLEQRFA